MEVTGSGQNLVVADNEISHNANDYLGAGDSAGTKFVQTDNLALSGNYVHHNCGHGLWADINNVDVLVEGNELSPTRRRGCS